MNIIFVRNVIVFTSFLVLTACGGGGGGDSTPSPAALTTINSFTMTGTSAPTAGDPIPINANVNAGAFSVDWDVSSSNPYHVKLYISEDAVFDKDTDTRLMSKNCGTNVVGNTYECNKVASFSCVFKTSNLISCGTISTANPEKNLTTFLTGLPMTAYFFIDACNALVTSCKTQSVEVEFQ